MRDTTSHGDHAGHAHNHGDHAGAGHSHAPRDFGPAFAIGISLNVAFVLIEGAYGYISGSMALVADAGHNVSDIMGLAAAWLAATLAKRNPNDRYTYGLRGASILAALFNAVTLLIACGAIAWEAIWRFANPEPVASLTVIVVASIGILINGATALLFVSGRKTDLNIKGAYLHMVADAAVSLGVVIAGLGIMFTGWLWLDPAASLLIVIVIVAGTWGLLRESTAMSLAAVPAGIKIDAVRAHLAALPGVTHVHDLHIWAMSTTEVAMTCHLVAPEGLGTDTALADLAAEMEAHFGIGHTTVQIERTIGICSQASCRI